MLFSQSQLVGRNDNQKPKYLTDKYSFLFSTYNSNSTNNSNALNKHSHTVTPIAQSH